ncbi:MAG TPA: hypothetical protein VF832_08580 [Longimicrobiales bacterium]
MKIAGMMLAAALLAPVALSAQGNPQGPGPRRGMMMRSAAAIAVAHKDDLGLSDDLVAKLTEIDKAAQEKNAPVIKQMQDLRAGAGDFQSMTDEQRQAFREKSAPLMQQIRDNNQAVRADVEKLLTADQVKKLGDIIQQEMPMRGPRPNG